jgi:hypothetical protein
MKSVIICLLTIGLCLPCLALDKSAKDKDCTTITTSETSFPFHITATCVDDEDILLTLVTRRTIRQCRDEAGGITTKVHIAFHGTAVGVTSGNEYVLNAQQKTITVASPSCEATVTNVFRELLISKGPLPDRVTHITSVLTFGSDCEVSSSIRVEERVCSK